MMTERDAVRRVKYDPKDSDQKAQIIKLLSEAFGSEYQHYYEVQLQRLATEDTTFVYEHNGEIVAHIQIAPYSYHHGTLSYSIAYLYAVCTLSCMRGRGIMREVVMPEVMTAVIGMGYDALFLVPSSAPLVHFYEQFGFEQRRTKAFRSMPEPNTPMIIPEDRTFAYLQAVDEVNQTGELPLEAGWMLYHPTPLPIALDTILIQPLT